MFEDASAAGLIDTITAAARASAAAEARKYAAIAELHRRRVLESVEMDKDAADGDDGLAAELSAALNIGHGRALGEMDIADMLAETFPRVNALFLAGVVSGRRVWILQRRTELVVDPDVIAELDAVLAERIVSWGPLSEWKFEQLVDAEIARLDPAAVRRVRQRVRDRDFTIGRRDGSGTVAYWGRMTDPDAAVAEKQIRRMIRSVCPDDPRTLAQRRGDAHAALMAGSTVLKCRCGDPDCPAAQVDDAAAGSVVVHVITDQTTLDATRETDGESVEDGLHGPRSVEGELGEIVAELHDDAQHEADTRTEEVDEPPVPDDGEEGADNAEDDGDGVPDGDPYAGLDWPVPEEPPATDEHRTLPPRTRPTRSRPGAIIPGYGVMPPVLLADLITRGATVRPIRIPTATPDPGYRPSAATDRFVRLRDLTCRAPGCDQPAEFADIDHTIPYPAGATHAGGLKCDCRKHHLIKTFHAGWSVRQLPDGTVITTTPTGHSYTTKPGITLLFPQWNISTPAPPAGPAPPPSAHRGLKMPKRKQTRSQAKTARINAERKRNESDGDPPPF
jgi:hypothetical protein